MKEIRWHIWNLFLVWLMILCFGIALVSAEKLGDRQNIYMLYQKESPISAAEAEQMQEQERTEWGDLHFTVWGVKNKLMVRNDFLGKEAETSGILFAGDSDLLLASDYRLNSADGEGCLVSEDLAYILFGTKEAEDRTLHIEEVEYTVRGVLPEAENTILYPCGSGTEPLMDAVALEVPEGTYKRDIFQTFSNRYSGFADEAAPLSVFSSMAKLAVMILPLLIGLLIFIPMFRSVFRQRKSPALLLISAGGTVILLVLYFWLAQLKIEVPLDLIPGKWSDFDTWTLTMETERTKLWTLLLAEKREPERVLVGYFMQAAKYTLFTLFFFVFFVRKFRFRSLGTLYVYGVIALCSSFFAIWYQREDGRVLVNSRCFWFIIIFYFAAVFLYEHKYVMKKWIKTNR